MQSVPSTINFQGRLTNATGSPIDGAESIVFTIWNAPTAGTSLWSETQPTVVVSTGIYNVILGSLVPLSPAVFSTPATYLGITVGGDAEMTPRLPLKSVPYALSAQSLGGGAILVPASGSVVVQSTMTVQGNAFSVGGSSLVVEGGQVSIGLAAPGATALNVGVDNNATGAIGLRLLSVNDPGGVGGFPIQMGFQSNNDQFLEFTRPTNGNWSYLLQDLASNSHFQIFSYPNNVAAFEAEPQLTNEALYVKANGYVGLGTTSPATKFHMSSGTLTIDGNTPTSILTTGSVGIGTAIPGASLDVENTGANAFKINGSTLVVTGGNVGIGTTNPLYTLDVAGQINTNGGVSLNGTLYSNPDYVFEPNYNFMTLDELRQFTAAQKHLPHVPSTSEVKKQGVEIFGQNRVVLENLEQAYLYIFQMDATMKHQQAEIEALNARLDELNEEKGNHVKK